MNVLFHAQFKRGPVGATGLVVTVDVDRTALADGTRTDLITGGVAAEGRRGCYEYLLADADLTLYDYRAVFLTTDTTVDDREIPGVKTFEGGLTAAEVEATVGNLPLALYPDPGTLGATLGAAADPWAADLSGYPAGTAGNILAVNLDAPVSEAVGSGGAGADPWAVALPGAYPPGSAGAILIGRAAPGDAMVLAPTGLDAIPITEPAGRLAANFREVIIQTWRRWFKRHAKVSASGTGGQINTYKDNGTIGTTQVYTVSGQSEDVGAAS